MVSSASSAHDSRFSEMSSLPLRFRASFVSGETRDVDISIEVQLAVPSWQNEAYTHAHIHETVQSQ